MRDEGTTGPRIRIRPTDRIVSGSVPLTERYPAVGAHGEPLAWDPVGAGTTGWSRPQASRSAAADTPRISRSVTARTCAWALTARSPRISSGALRVAPRKSVLRS